MPKKIHVSVRPFDLQKLQREVNILLISDLHYDVKKESKVGYDKTLKGVSINESLVKSLSEQGKNWHPDIVVIAGDLVNQNQSKNYRDFIHLIKLLVDRFPVLRNAIFTTPGNHDVDRKTKQPFIDNLKKRFVDEKKIKSSYTKNKLIDIIHTVSKENILNNKELLSQFKAFEKSYFKVYLEKREDLIKKGILGKEKDIIYPVTGFKSFYTVSIHGITLASHNSSFFCNFSEVKEDCLWNDRNNLFLVKDFVDATLNNLENCNEPIVSFLHHPFYYLHESEHIWPINDGGNDVYNNFTNIVNKSDLLLSGHVHGDLQDPSFLQNSAYIVTNGTSFTTDDFNNKCYPYTYALLKINKQLRHFTFKKFIYKADDPKNGIKKGFHELKNKWDSVYTFRRDEKMPPPSLEYEKVRTLYYFSKLPEYKKNQLYCFFLYQLDLFQQDIKETIGDFEFETLTIRGKKAVQVKGGIKEPIIILLIDKKSPIIEIRKFLESGIEHFKKDYRRVYFSLSMKNLLEDKVISDFRVKEIADYYRALISTSKVDFVSVNLLYH